jgi:hypothetical protein
MIRTIISYDRGVIVFIFLTQLQQIMLLRQFGSIIYSCYLAAPGPDVPLYLSMVVYVS